MCAVSAVVGTWVDHQSPNFIKHWPGIQPNTASDMLRVIELLEKIDKKLDAQNCKVAEPDKERVKQALREIIKDAQ